MKLIKIAVDQRIVQLKRKQNMELNPMIKTLIEQEIRELEDEFKAVNTTNKK